METLKALGAIFHKLELRDKERRLGLTTGLTPELDAYFKILGRFHAVYRYPEDQRGYDLQAEELFKNFYVVLEVCALKYGQKGETLVNAVSESIRSLRLDGSFVEAAGTYLKFRANDEFRVIT